MQSIMLQEITDEDIEYSEQILFGRIGVFDSERKSFIKHVTTCDLQAVPGSGKTTALLAKLLIIEQYLPFKSGRGILVISHTNAAVNEIKDKIGSHCPKLFSYPNFVGTIQSFVDYFLATPFYHNKFKHRIIRIDNEIYEAAASRFSQSFLGGYTNQEQNNAKNYLRSRDQYRTVRFANSNTGIILTDGHNGELLNIKKPRGNTRPENYVDWTENEKEKVSSWVFKFKKSIMANGFLCYDDAYFLATEYIRVVPRIKTILRTRFAYVFVDEMQDMEKHQYDLLENIFFEDGNGNTVYQRIGDKNQAIFNGSAATTDFWVDRERKLELNGSHRLNSYVGAIVEKFALSPIRIVGLKCNPDGSTIEIKPHLFVYTDDSVGSVIREFARVVSELQTEGKIDRETNNKFKALCWTTTSEEGKTRLDSYFEAFSTEEHRPKIDYTCLDSYLVLWNKDSNALENIRKNLLNSLLNVMRLEGIADGDNRNFTKRELMALLSIKGEVVYNEFRLKIYQWSISCVRGLKDVALTEMRQYLPRFLQIFGKEVEHSQAFISGTHVFSNETETVTTEKSNFIENDGVRVEITTVHSAKGQTHTGTLYLESFYQRGGGGNYESQRLANAINGVAFTGPLHEYASQSMKMVYVGFSRPTHLLGFAVNKTRFDEKLSGIDQNIWKIIEV
jgi:DNA helicase II / ATP-dependent DNA helicase PcrA